MANWRSQESCIYNLKARAATVMVRPDCDLDGAVADVANESGVASGAASVQAKLSKKQKQKARRGKR